MRHVQAADWWTMAMHSIARTALYDIIYATDDLAVDDGVD